MKLSVENLCSFYLFTLVFGGLFFVFFLGVFCCCFFNILRGKLCLVTFGQEG